MPDDEWQWPWRSALRIVLRIGAVLAAAAAIVLVLAAGLATPALLAAAIGIALAALGRLAQGSPA